MYKGRFSLRRNIIKAICYDAFCAKTRTDDLEDYVLMEIKEVSCHIKNCITYRFVE